jgi:hypothetical protein
MPSAESNGDDFWALVIDILQSRRKWMAVRILRWLKRGPHVDDAETPRH